jgi:hypothetical protein
MNEGPGQRRRVLLGVGVTAEAVALLLAVLAVAGLVGLAVMNWLEHFA